VHRPRDTRGQRRDHRDIPNVGEEGAETTRRVGPHSIGAEVNGRHLGRQDLHPQRAETKLFLREAA